MAEGSSSAAPVITPVLRAWRKLPLWRGLPASPVSVGGFGRAWSMDPRRSAHALRSNRPDQDVFASGVRAVVEEIAAGEGPDWRGTREAASSRSRPHPEVPAPAGLEGGLRPAARALEPSFEAFAIRLLRMRARVGAVCLSIATP